MTLFDNQQPHLKALAYQLLGNVAYETGEYQTAVNQYEEALLVDHPGKTTANTTRTMPHLAAAYRALNEFDNALAIFQETEDFITELFSRVDDKMLQVTKHTQAVLYPSEVVTLALLFALKGRGNRAFYRWLKNNWLHLFPKLPHRTRLFRLFNSHQHWIDLFMADPSLMGEKDVVPSKLARKDCPTNAGSSGAKFA